MAWVDDQPRCPLGGEDVAAVQAGARQHPVVAVSGRARNSAIPALASPGSILSAALAAAYSRSNSSAHAAHICASGRNGPAVCGWPSGGPGMHLSISSAYADSLWWAACSRTAPFPSHSRSPAASSPLCRRGTGILP